MQGTRFSHFSPRWLLFIAWGIIIAWLSLTPEPPEIETGFFGWDKVQHAAAYGVFTLLAGWAFCRSAGNLKLCWLKAAVTAVAFGALLEITQGLFTETRAAELGDLLADMAGAACAYALGLAGASYGRGRKK